MGTQPCKSLCSFVAVPHDNCCLSAVLGAKRKEKEERQTRETNKTIKRERKERDGTLAPL
jgi:hypothetical protein